MTGCGGDAIAADEQDRIIAYVQLVGTDICCKVGR